MYECKTCGSKAAVVDGAVVRTCAHTDAVVLQLVATATGDGGM